MIVHHVLVLPALLLPLALDTFALATALGVAGLPTRVRFRTSLVLAAFEAGMPIVGFLLGRGLGDLVGRFAGYTGALAIAVAGVLLLRSDEEAAERQRLRFLAHAQGLAIIDLGIAISLDEFGIGLGLGLLQLPLLAAVAYLGAQAFVAAQFGLWLGGRVREEWLQGAERLAGLLLVATAIVFVAVKVTGHQL